MFAPRAAKLKAETGSKQKSALQRGTILSRHDDSGVEQADVLQPFSRGGSGHKTESPACAWDFAKMPVSSPGREGQFRSPPSLPKPLLIGSIQPKLKVGAIDDPLEHEADRLADQVMRMPASDPASISPPQISRKCAGCEDEEKLQKKQTRPQTVAGEAPAGVHETLRSAGQPLDSETRAFFEPRFRRDLSQVRIHADTRAAESAESVYARAYTVANHVVFGHGQYAPRTADGRHLLAHELTHTVQQQGSNGALSATAALQRAPGDNPPSSGSTRFFDVSRGPLTKAEKQKLVELREKLGLPVTPTEGDTSIVGILVFETGEELELHSGEFGGYHAGVRRTEGPAGPGSGSTRFNRTHVETFAAQAMRKRGVKRAVLLIEKEPCAVCGGYDKGHPEAETKTPLASKVLPEDAQLLVVDGDYVTYLRSTRSAPAKPAPKPPPSTAAAKKAEPVDPKTAEPAKTTGPAKAEKTAPNTKSTPAAKPAPKPPPSTAAAKKTEPVAPKTTEPTKTTEPATTAKPETPTKAATPPPDTKISPHAFESSAGANQEATAGAAGGAAMMIHQGQIQNLENAEEALAEEALRRIQPDINRLVSAGQWVAVRVFFYAPKPSLTAFVFKEQSDISHYAYITISHGDTKSEALGEQPPRMNAVVGPPETYEAPRKPREVDHTIVVHDIKIYPPEPVTVTDADFIDIHNRVVGIREELSAIREPTAGERVALDYLDAARSATDVQHNCMEDATRIRLTSEAVNHSLSVLEVDGEYPNTPLVGHLLWVKSTVDGLLPIVERARRR